MDLVRQIQQLQRLETVRYPMDKIISGERDIYTEDWRRSKHRPPKFCC